MVLALILVLGIGAGLWFGGSWLEQNEWQSKYDTLEGMKDSLQAEAFSWQAEYDSLEDTKRQLDEDYESLQTQMQELSTQRDSLQDSYDLLETERDTLQDERDALQSEKDSLQTSYDSLTTWYDGIRDEVNRRLGHQEDRKLFVTPDDAAVGTRVQAETDGFSDTVSEQWADYRHMYDWVVDNVEYNSDSRSPYLPLANGSVSWQQEYWRMPSETLGDKKGDCEDMATLLASMILNYTSSAGYPCWCITWVSNYSAHAAVAFPVQVGKLTILDPAGKYYTETFGSLGSKDVSTAVADWLAHCQPEPGIRVSGVFSDTVYETFATTAEFVEWALAQ